MIRPCCTRAIRGFTIVELMVTTLMTTAVMGAVLTVIIPAQATFHAQGEVADLHQRLRAAVDLIGADVRASDGVRPYRVGGTRDDAVTGVYYRVDTISVLDVPSSALSADAAATRTYYLKSDARTSTFELMQFDGRETDLPVVEHVVGLSFDYYGDTGPASLIRLDPAILTDGPWSEDTAHRRFDADLLRVRRVDVHLRLESTAPSLRGRAGLLFVHGGTSSAPERFLPDETVELHIALRNSRMP